MKKTLLILCFASSSLNLFSQLLPNGGMEEWENVFFSDEWEKMMNKEFTKNDTANFDRPVKWSSGHECAASDIDSECFTATVKSTKANSGNYAALVTDDKSIGTSQTGLSLYPYGYTDFPTGIEFYTNTSGLSAKDVLNVRIDFHNDYFYRSGSGKIMAGKLYYSKQVSLPVGTDQYVKQRIELNIPDTSKHSSFTLDFFISNIDKQFNNSSVLVDDISFVFDSKVSEDLQRADARPVFELKPNPTSDFIQISREIDSYQITACDGTVVKLGIETKIDVSKLIKGNYFISITDLYGKVDTQILIIE